MSRPITLCTGQWADLSLEETAAGIEPFFLRRIGLTD